MPTVGQRFWWAGGFVPTLFECRKLLRQEAERVYSICRSRDVVGPGRTSTCSGRFWHYSIKSVVHPHCIMLASTVRTVESLGLRSLLHNPAAERSNRRALCYGWLCWELPHTAMSSYKLSPGSTPPLADFNSGVNVTPNHSHASVLTSFHRASSVICLCFNRFVSLLYVFLLILSTNLLGE